VYVDVRVNEDLIGSLTITRVEDGRDPDSVNTYTWDYVQDGELRLRGRSIHRYGDGAMVLVQRVLSQIEILEQMEAL
jgi:hypothetical protein